MRCLLPSSGILVQMVVALRVTAQCLAAPAPLSLVLWVWARVSWLRRALTGPAQSCAVDLPPSPSGAAEEDRDSVSGLVDLDRDDSLRTVLHLIWKLHSMQEPASVAPNRCKTSLAPIYGLQSKEGRPFRGPLAAPAAPEVNEKGPGKSPPDGVSPPLHVGGCLSVHWRHWQTIGAGSWVLSVLRDRYRIPFLDFPPLSRTPISFPTYRAGSPRSLALRQDVEMLSKDTLEIVLDPDPGFYSRLFLVEKVTRGLATRD